MHQIDSKMVDTTLQIVHYSPTCIEKRLCYRMEELTCLKFDILKLYGYTDTKTTIHSTTTKKL